MAPKLQLEKQAWQWAETTEPDQVNQTHVETAYRIHFKPCTAACRFVLDHIIAGFLKLVISKAKTLFWAFFIYIIWAY